MFPFWETVVAPLVKASRASRVLEIGALRGETTAKMFDQLGPDSELHVIDPLPQFDPAEHEQAFPGRYVFHRDLSLNVLPDLPPMDVALIDGDHNWYTVYHELKQLERTARESGQPLPVLVLHDVAWPYGHRDLYYEPSQIPEEFRQPYARAGMAPGHYRLLPEGGFNVNLCNAIDGGGPRNGVMCALEDFLDEYDRPYRKVILSFYFGLAIVVDEERLAATPELAAVLDHFGGPSSKAQLLALSERIRVDEAVHVHNWNRVLEGQIQANGSRYLDLLKSTLLDLPYLENEVRLEYLIGLGSGATADVNVLRDPVRTLPVRYDRLAQARTAGRSTDVRENLSYFPYTDMGRPALDHLEHTLASLDDVPGDLIEIGVGRGGGGIFLRGWLDAVFEKKRTVWMADAFVARTPESQVGDASPFARFGADLNQVRDGFARFGLLDDRVRFVQGPFDNALEDAPLGSLALVRIGEAAGPALAAVLAQILPKVSVGGTVVVAGVAQPRIEKALGELRDRLGIVDELTRIDWNTVAWTVASPVTVATSPAGSADSPAKTPHRVSIPPSIATAQTAVTLSVVVVFYNMRREAARTLRSLSRSYQRGIDDLAYEVLVVENGSGPDQRLSREEVAAYGPEFRLLNLGSGAVSSPTTALNRGIAESRGDTVALMIDGAHVLTPGVLRLGLTAMDTYAPAIVATQQWYVGPGQQGDSQQAGYDQVAEDRLFNNIKWPVDGYRLFEIGHFIGDRDWFDGIVESNCLFAPRTLLEQIGGFDDSFDMAGGGYANLELFERLGAHPGINAASILGEGTFHQFHGGTTTNVADEAVRRDRVFSYGEHFSEIRGRGLMGLNTPVNFVGSMATKAARRTRSRREITLAFNPGRDTVTTTDTEPVPVPDELKFAAVEALWDRQAWRDATWLGLPVNRFPTDLHSYQELMALSRPDAVVLIGDDPGLAGRALFAASVCDQLGHGRVLAVGASAPDVPEHPRITAVHGDAVEAHTIATVRNEVGDDTALVFIGLGATQRVIAAFEAYAPMVPVDGHLVIEHTVVNGRPAASGFGPGPHEAVVALLGQHREFVPDVAFERYTITFNKGGFLRRTALS